MVKTTVYLPDDLKNALERVARQRETSEAEIIRTAIATFVAAQERPRPKLGLFDSGDPTFAERVDEELAGFGEK